MARVTVEDCLEQIPNRFALALLASMRARTLLSNAECTLKTDNKPCVSALREIAVGNVHYNMDVNDVLSGKVNVAKKSKKSRKY